MNAANIALPEKQARSVTTGSLAYWDGQQWQPLPDEDGDALRATLTQLTIQIAILHREVAALRLGMIDSGNCNDVAQLDIDRLLLET